MQFENNLNSYLSFHFNSVYDRWFVRQNIPKMGLWAQNIALMLFNETRSSTNMTSRWIQLAWVQLYIQYQVLSLRQNSLGIENLTIESCTSSCFHSCFYRKTILWPLHMNNIQPKKSHLFIWLDNIFVYHGETRYINHSMFQHYFNI